MTSDQLAALRAQLDAARTELHEAERVLALLMASQEAPSGDAVAVARGVIERDLARRRVEAWTAVLDRLRREGVRLGLFVHPSGDHRPLVAGAAGVCVCGREWPHL